MIFEILECGFKTITHDAAVFGNVLTFISPVLTRMISAS